MPIIRLFELFPEETGIVKGIRTKQINETQKRTLLRLADLGLIEGTPVTCVGTTIFGTPRAYRIRGAVLVLRREEASLIEVEIQ